VYGTIGSWRAYALARGDSAPTDASDPDATSALQRASDYIRLRYVMRYSLTETSEAVIEAARIAASLELAEPGFWSKTFTPSQTKVLTKVDAISWTPVSNKNYEGADAMQPVSPLIEGLLAPGEAVSTSGLWAI